jgi:adenylate cyclase
MPPAHETCHCARGVGWPVAAQRDFQILEELAIAGATDYYAELIPVGMVTEAFPDNGIGFSFATDHPDGFGNDDLQLIEAVLPAVSLAIVSDAEHTIAAGLLAAYLGSDVGRRVHAGVVERGSVESIRAVLWYARSYFRVMVRWAC